MVSSPTHSSASPSATQGDAQNGVTGTTGSSQMQAWVQGAISKITDNDDGGSSAPNPVSVPISINTGTFPGTPAVRLLGDCHFLHRLCQLLHFCLIFWRRQAPQLIRSAQKNPTDSLPKGLPIGKLEDGSLVTRPSLWVAKLKEGQAVRTGQLVLGTKGVEEVTQGKLTRLGSGNAGQGYTFEEVNVLFLILVDLCRRTAGLSHTLPTSQVGIGNLDICLHYIDGNYIVVPEVVEASLGPHMQNMQRLRGADYAGLLRELDLHPPSEEWHSLNMFGGSRSDPEDVGPDPLSPNSGDGHTYLESPVLWPRKRRLSERDAAFGLNTSVGLGSYLGIMVSRRDVVTAVWKTGLQGSWYKCVRCLRQTSAFVQPGAGVPANEHEAGWISRWVHSCPMCGGAWV